MTCVLGRGAGDKDPRGQLKFYRNEDPEAVFQMRLETVSTLLNENVQVGWQGVCGSAGARARGQAGRRREFTTH